MEELLDGTTVDIAIWMPFASALFGGLLSLAGSLTTTGFAQSIARREKREEKEQLEAERAYAVLFKLLDGYNTIANLQRQIHEMFDEADQSGTHDLAPWAKVRPLIGASIGIKEIDPSETSFLIGEKKAELINRIHLIQKRMQHVVASSDSYSGLRIEYQQFMETRLTSGEVQDGAVFAAEMHARDAAAAEFRQAVMNNLIGSIMEFLDVDVPEAWNTIVEFKQAAEDRYGELFPVFKVEIAS